MLFCAMDVEGAAGKSSYFCQKHILLLHDLYKGYAVVFVGHIRLSLPLLHDSEEIVYSHAPSHGHAPGLNLAKFLWTAHR